MDNSPVLEAIYSRLTLADISALDAIVPTLDDPYATEWCRTTRGTPRWKSLTLRFCTHFVPESRQRTLLSHVIPPEDIHMMQRADTFFVGDLYSSDMAVSCLNAARMKFTPDANYLDFGCSSGSLVRMMAAYSPNSRWHGVDPVSDSVAWASEALPSGHFSQSAQNPPLSFEENYFSGVTAISIWSHFAKEPALNWFAEMARLIKPGGWLFFTTHGLQTIKWLKDKVTPETVERIRLSLRQNEYHFEDVFGSQKHYGLETAEWGDSYLSPRWLVENLSHQWDLKFFLEGRNQLNQDCYVLKRRWV